MKSIVSKINDFFGDDLVLTVGKRTIKITVGNRTLHIKLPTVVGADSKAQ